MIQPVLAVSFWQRFWGLRFMDHDTCLLLPQCCFIHTIGLKYPIHVAFLDTQYRVIQLRFIRPNGLAFNQKAVFVLESYRPLGLSLGDLPW